MKLKKILDTWFAWCKKNNTSPIQVCLEFSFRTNVDKIIVGIYSLDQLKNLIKTIKSLKIKSRNFPIEKYTNLVDPRTWN